MKMARLMQIESWFSHKQLTKEQIERCSAIRASAKEFARIIVNNSQESADQTAALRKLRECVMTIMSSISCEENI